MYQKLRICYMLTILIHIAEGLCSAADTAAFNPGEKLHYIIFLAEYPAGEVTFEVKPMAALSSIPAYHFLMTAKISPVLDEFLLLGDRVESYADIGMTHALLYKEHNDGASQQDITVIFDWKKNEAQYCIGRKKYMPVSLVSGSFDPLSVLYALRLIDLKRNYKISKPVSNGLQCVVVKASVIGKQKVRVARGEYDTYMVELLLGEFSALFKGTTMKLWISADARRLPVKIVCEFPIGEIMAELAAQ
jgi:hypothetical protein